MATLSFLPELPPGFDKEKLPPEVLARPSLFDAVRSQLGLKLVSTKGPVEYYVVEHIEKPEVNPGTLNALLVGSIKAKLLA